MSNFIIYYSGHGTEDSGDWCFDNEEVLSKDYIEYTWQNLMDEWGGKINF